MPYFGSRMKPGFCGMGGTGTAKLFLREFRDRQNMEQSKLKKETRRDIPVSGP